MAYKLEIRRPAMAGLLRASADTALFLRLRDAIYALAEDPRPRGSVSFEVRPGVPESRRLRVGEFRIAYDVEDASHTVRVFSVWRLGDPA